MTEDEPVNYCVTTGRRLHRRREQLRYGEHTGEFTDYYPADSYLYSNRSAPVKGDGVTPTDYSALKIFYEKGDYVETDNWTHYTTGDSYSVPNQDLITVTPYLLGIDGFTMSPSDIYTPNYAPHSDPAVIKALEKAANVNWDAATELAESRKTAEYISGCAMKLLRSVKALQKGDVRAFKRMWQIKEKDRFKSKSDDYADAAKFLADKSASAWLQYQYAIMPTVLSMGEAVKLLDDKVTRAYEDFKGTVSTPYTYQIDKSSGVSTFEGSYTNRCNLRLQAKSTKWETASEFGIASPLNVAWELVPFSFLADYVLPIGQWLRALSVIPNVDFIHGSLSVQVTGTVTTVKTSRYNGGSGNEDSRTVANVKLYRRLPINRIPVPVPRFKNPLSGAGNVTRATNIVALAYNLIAGKWSPR